jgi:hypothetical protein
MRYHRKRPDVLREKDASPIALRKGAAPAAQAPDAKRGIACRWHGKWAKIPNEARTCFTAAIIPLVVAQIDRQMKGDPMKHDYLAATTLLAAGLMLLFAIGCASSRGAVGVEWGAPDYPPEHRGYKQGPPPHAPAHGYRAKHRYRYYPDQEVYYDTGRRIYFYIEGETWKTGVSLPSPLRMRLGDYVTVELDDDTPYDYHARQHPHQNGRIPPGQAKKYKD